MRRLKLALAGVGGYGAKHVQAARVLEEENLAQIAAFAEPAEDSEAVAALKEGGARHYTALDELLDNEKDVELVCIAAPVPYHYRLAAEVLSRGLHLYLEKPPVVRIQDLRRLIQLEEQNNCFCVVGFQDVARPNIIALKHRLCEGALGKLRAVHAHARSTRGNLYYERAPWAGKTHHDGEWVLDGPMNNASSHVLNMALYLAGDEPYEFALPTKVQGELYRAARIEGEDANCLRAETEQGVDICIHLTHASPRQHGRSWTIIGDKGIAELNDSEGARLPNEHLSPETTEFPGTTLLRRLVEVVLESDEPLLMPLAESEGFVLLSNGAYESSGKIHPVPEEHIVEEQTDKGLVRSIRHIETLMADGARSGRLLSECDAPWAVETPPFDLAGYDNFPARWQE